MSSNEVNDNNNNNNLDTAHLLSRILSLEELDTDLYRGTTPTNKYSFPRIFGGQTVSQSLMAASRTVPATVKIHSLHSYFLRPGDVTLPIIYQVQRVRDGTSFCTRTVVARQNGKPIFTLTCSFQSPEAGYEHSRRMPVVPPPDTLLNREETMMRLSSDPRLPEQFQKLVRKQLGVPFPVDIRYVRQRDPIAPERMEPRQHIWMRARDGLGGDPHIHECAAAYLSDFSLLETATLPHGVSFHTGLQAASLDHSMWFHDSFRADEWLLYDIYSPRSIGSRGFCFGFIYALDGRLVISTAQEGLIRKVTPLELGSAPRFDSPEDEEDQLIELHRARSKKIIYGDSTEALSAKL